MKIFYRESTLIDKNVNMNFIHSIQGKRTLLKTMRKLMDNRILTNLERLRIRNMPSWQGLEYAVSPAEG